MAYHIYELVDPTTNEIGYIGITNNPAIRLQQHLTISETNPAKNQWVQNIKDQGLSVQMNVIETIDDVEKAYAREKHWINFHSSRGVSLYNIRNVLKPINAVEEPSTHRAKSLASVEKRADKYAWADYDNELLADPEYLDDEFAAHISVMQKMSGRIFSEEEIRTGLEAFTLAFSFTYAGDTEEKYVDSWYKKQFEKGGRFEGKI